MTTRRRSLPFAEWPEADRDLWQVLVAEGDILEGGGPGAAWAPTTKSNVRKACGYWLFWLSQNGLLAVDTPPMDRVTPDRVRAYVEDLQASVASSTVFTYILDLLRFVKATSPERDWTWLTGVKNRLWARITPARNKISKIRPAQDLFCLGLDLMDTAKDIRCRYNPVAAHTQFRDGFVIALLAARPIRLKNITAMEIGRHLIRIDDIHWLRFDASEIKNRVAIEVTLPEALTDYVDTYLTEHRPVLLGGAISNRVWISRFGSNLSETVIRHHVKNRTEKAFGQALSPHLFRDCAVTSIAIEDPDHVRIAANILGHSRLSTTRRYYDQSHMLAAGRSYQSAVVELRDTMRLETRGPYKTRPSAIDKDTS